MTQIAAEATASSPPPELLTIGETMALITSGNAGMIDGASLTLASGGAESNVAVGAAALGIDAAWMSRVGADPFGDLVVTSIQERGVDISAVQVDQARPTGLMFKQPSPSGSRVLYYRSGSAASALSPEDLHGLSIPRLVHVSGITPALSASARSLVESVLDGALAPAVTSFDVNYRPVLWASADHAASALLDLARRADVVFVGRDEAEVLWGTSTVESVRAFLPTVPRLVIKDGAIEAVEFHGDHVTRVPAQQVDVVEPVGAGDAFAAGWIAGFLRAGSAEARLRAGHDAAAAVLQSLTDIPAPLDRTPVAGTRI